MKKRERSIILLIRKRLPKTGNELFDEKFIEDSLNSIENLSYPALEKMFLSQGMKKSYGYSSSGSQNVSVFTIMVVAVSLFVSAAFLLILKLNRNKNDRV